MRRAVLALTAALLLVACSGDPEATSTTTPAPTTTADDATTTTSATPTSGEAEPSALALRGDGLGVVDLGATPEDAIAAVGHELGDPAKDTGWADGAGAFGACPVDRVRGVQWGDPGGLVLLFADGETPQGSGQHLFSWRASKAPPAVATAQGLGYGATATDAEELYPDHVERVPAEDPFPAFLRIEVEGGQITAYLDDADIITNLEGGTPCGE